MTNTIRWGILGDANIARKALIPAIHQAEYAQLDAIASRSGSVEKTARKYHISKAYQGYDALLEDEEIDVVYIPLPNSLHAEWTKKAAKAGKHVLCEKPASLTEKETAGMIEVCRKHRVLFIEAFMYQFHPQFDKVKEIIASREIGNIRLMRSRFSFQLDDVKNVRFDKTLGGGCLYDVGCYPIHAFRYILEQELLKAYAQAHISDKTDVDVTTASMLTFENDVQALFDASFENHPEEVFEIIGEKGRIVVNAPFRPDTSPDGKGRVILQKDDGSQNEYTLPGDSFTIEVEHFSKCVAENNQPMYSGESTLNNMKVIEACYQSISRGQVVQVN